MDICIIRKIDGHSDEIDRNKDRMINMHSERQIDTHIER